MGKINDLSGNVYGKLTVLQLSHTKNRKSYWVCQCSCDNKTITIVRSDCLTSGNTKSCGCLNYEHAIITHNMSKTKLYHIWASMKNRCYNENDTNFKHYGGKGIKVYDDWINSFEDFHLWSIDNGYIENSNLTIDRIDTYGNYEPSNCRWVTQKIQNNNKTNNVLIEYNGEIKNIQEWSEYLGIKWQTLYSRIFNLKWNIEKALTEPVKSKV